MHHKSIFHFNIWTTENCGYKGMNLIKQLVWRKSPPHISWTAALVQNIIVLFSLGVAEHHLCCQRAVCLLKLNSQLWSFLTVGARLCVTHFHHGNCIPCWTKQTSASGFFSCLNIDPGGSFDGLQSSRGSASVQSCSFVHQTASSATLKKQELKYATFQ